MGHPAGSIVAKVSVGELLDKITILELKSARFTDQRKVRNVLRELGELRRVAGELPIDAGDRALIEELKRINTLLWDVEDEIRQCESCNDFGERFIRLARSVYQYNDRRADLKRSLNERMGSELIEEKSYCGDQ